MRSAMLYGLRRQRDLSQDAMAKILHLSRTTYLKKENNVDLFLKSEIDILLKHFNKTYEEIFKEVI
jgi:DNA-binding XRE family transcriptional regulator